MSYQAPIPTYIINLAKRKDRKKWVLDQFQGRNEFNLTLITAHEHATGSFGLWCTLQNILNCHIDDFGDYVLICEDDHQFTKNYTSSFLFQSIDKAIKHNADILSGGVSWFKDATQISPSLFSVETFTGLQFTFIFRHFFEKILAAEFNENDDADLKISSLAQSKLVIHPFISIQKSFGYSDVTSKNALEGRVDELFLKSSDNFAVLKKVSHHYKNLSISSTQFSTVENYDGLKLPVYVINLPERADRLSHIIQQFSGKNEFELNIVNAVKQKPGAFGLWLTIRQIIRTQTGEDDFIIICEDDHEFTNHYNKEYLIKNIVEAHSRGADILLGGIGGFQHAIPVTENLIWINPFWSTQFLIVYQKFFKKILTAPFNQTVTADGLLSELTSNKMVMFPFISIQREFGYSDVTSHNNEAGHISKLFTDSTDRLSRIQDHYLRKKQGQVELPNLKQNRIILVVPFFNAGSYLQECYHSIKDQQYTNYEAWFVDDMSTDGCVELLPKLNHKIRLVRNSTRQYQLANFEQILSMGNFEDEDIIAFLDGDDYFLQNDVLQIINHIYHSQRCLVSYGQYVTTSGLVGHCSGYQKEEFANLRKLDWRASHLKTFKFKVYKEFLKQDPHLKSYIDLDTTSFYTVSGDVALMHPLLEIAGFDNVYFNPAPVYVYRLHEANDACLDRERQFEIARKINQFPSFKQAF